MDEPRSTHGGDERLAHIEIAREDARVGRLNAWRIWLDGGSVGQIRAGERVVLNVAPRQYVLNLTSARLWRSPKRTIVLVSGQRIRFECRPTARPWTLWYVLLSPSTHFIQLDRVDDHDEGE